MIPCQRTTSADDTIYLNLMLYVLHKEIFLMRQWIPPTSLRTRIKARVRWSTMTLFFLSFFGGGSKPFFCLPN